MENQLSPDQSQALALSTDSRLTVVDPTTNRRYVLVDAEDFARLEDLDAIRTGISQMESGLRQPLAEAMNDVRDTLRNRP